MLVVGPLLWLVAVLLVALVVHRERAVEIGLAVTLIAFVVSVPVASTALWLRRRDERVAAERS